MHPLQQNPAVRVKPAFRSITGVQQAAFSPHPNRPLSCLCHGRAVWWRSDDGGLNWYDSSTGFGGESARKAHFDPSDWRRIDFACADIGALFTPNAGDWCVESNCTGPRNSASSQWGRMRAQVGAGNVAYRSATDITRLPDTAAVTNPAARGRRIMALGGNVRQFIFTQDKGQTTWNDRIEQPVSVGGGGTARWFADYSRQNPNVVYCGQNVSTDGGTTWGETQAGARICAMSHQDGDVVYAQNGLQSFLRSTDRGASWEAYFSAGYRLAFNATQPAFWLSPHDHRRAFTWSSTRDVLMLYGDPGSVRSTLLPLLPQYDAPPPGFQIKCVGFSGTDPRLIYALVDVTGAPCIFRGDFDAEFAAITWTDISKNCSRLAQSSDLAVHPQTGDVFVMTGHGIWVYPPPGGSEANSVWANCPKPIPNGWSASNR